MRTCILWSRNVIPTMPLTSLGRRAATWYASMPPADSPYRTMGRCGALAASDWTTSHANSTQSSYVTVTPRLTLVAP